LQLDRLQAIQTVLWAYETLTDTLLSAAPTSGLSHVLALELHALHGGPEDLRRPPQTTLHSAEEALIDWLNRLQSVVASARDQVRAGEVDETLHTLDSVSAALVTYSAARRMRLDMLGGVGPAGGWRRRDRRLLAGPEAQAGVHEQRRSAPLRVQLD